MATNSKVGVIGAGKMGEALMSGLIKSDHYKRDQIAAFEKSKERAKEISAKYGIQMMNGIPSLVEFSDIIFITVKPIDVDGVLEEIAQNILEGKIIVSMAAGIRIERLSKHLPKDVPIVRVMPNLACAVREGMIAVSPSKSSSEDDALKVKEILALTGKVVQIEERYMDAVTGLSGSGPAFIYLIIEALADAGVRLGLSRELSLLLSAQTVLGAGKLAVETGEHPARLRDMVVTPAGTTIEGLLELERGGVRVAIIDAVSRATQRARELAPPNS